MKCSYSGCKNEATWALKQLVGKKQSLAVCEKHAPQWAKTGTKSWLEQETGCKAYDVERLKK